MADPVQWFENLGLNRPREAETDDERALRTLLSRSNLGDADMQQLSVLARRVDLNKPRENPYILTAASRHNPDVILELLRAGADIETQDKRGTNALMKAASSLQCENLNFLLQNGAEPNARNLRGETALMIVVDNFDPEDQEQDDQSMVCLNLLLSHPDIEVNKVDNRRQTALSHAAQSGNARAVHKLLNSRANPTIPNDDGRTPDELTDNPEIAALIRRYQSGYLEQSQGAAVLAGRVGDRHRVPPSIAKNIGSFLFRSRRSSRSKSRKSRKVRKSRKSHRKSRKASRKSHRKSRKSHRKSRKSHRKSRKSHRKSRKSHRKSRKSHRRSRKVQRKSRKVQRKSRKVQRKSRKVSRKANRKSRRSRKAKKY